MKLSGPAADFINLLAEIIKTEDAMLTISPHHMGNFIKGREAMKLEHVWNTMKWGRPMLTGATWLFIGFAPPAFAANEPVPGIYQETEFTTLVSRGAGDECDNWGPAGQAATPRIFTYPGPAQRGATERAPSNDLGSDFIFVITYQMTPPGA
jgi:hypothetical protein